MALAIALAFFFGYALTLSAVTRAGVSLKAAIGVALAADTLSIAIMEIVDNGVLLAVPGAMEAHLSDGLFWGALTFAFAVAFLVTTPVNKWLIGRGKGHAVVHQYHH
jgi:multisubunit Na+/H+ antiporter MnhG subunit